jgi:GTPase SAR1 family protein
MTMPDVQTLVTFPDGFPRVKSGLLLPDMKTVITGHETGLVVQSDISSGRYSVIDDCHFEITTVTCSARQEILVGCTTGLMYIFPLKDPSRKRIIQQPGFGKRDRVWRIAWLDADTFFQSSNYGVLVTWHRDAESNWSSTPLSGHFLNAVFGLALSDDGLLVSGDYRGRVLVRDVKRPDQILDQSTIQSGVQGVAWYADKTFAAVDQGGRIHVFESIQGGNQWRPVYETDTATSRGESIHITRDGHAIYAGTGTELIQFDLETQQMLQTRMDDIRAIFSDSQNVFLITAKGVSSLLRSKIEVPARFISYQYAKVSLIGHTGVGKSTLCSNLVNKTAVPTGSTFGKRIWINDMETAAGVPHRRVILHDHGGQETVLGTFIPFLTDSDIILVFFKQTDYDTFESALHILDELSDIVSKRTKIFLVKTFIDQEMGDIDQSKIQALIDSKRIVDCLEVDPRDTAKATEIAARVMGEISWETAKTMIESQYADGIMRTIPALQEAGATVVSVDRVKQSFEELVHVPIHKTHLKFLLQNLSTQGIIEYYPDITKSESVIINDDRYNKLRTKIPIHVRNRGGRVQIAGLHKEFDPNYPPEYVDILDSIYLAYGISVENDGWRIFPGILRKGGIDLKEPYASLLKPVQPEYSGYAIQKPRIGSLFDALSDLKMFCVDASQEGGLFAWETNACIYFTLENSFNAVSGNYLKITYYVGGEKPDFFERLRSEFTTLLDRFYGPEVELPGTVKKKEPGNTSTT